MNILDLVLKMVHVAEWQSIEQENSSQKRSTFNLIN